MYIIHDIGIKCTNAISYKSSSSLMIRMRAWEKWYLKFLEGEKIDTYPKCLPYVISYANKKLWNSLLKKACKVDYSTFVSPLLIIIYYIR